MSLACWAQALSNYRRSVKLAGRAAGRLARRPKNAALPGRGPWTGEHGLLPPDCGAHARKQSRFTSARYEVRRELLCGTSTGSVADVRTQPSGPAELDDLLYLVSTVHLMAGLMDDRGHVAEAEDLRRQLKDDLVAAAARLSAPEFQKQRTMWASRLTTGQLPLFDQSRLRDMMINHRLALILDPGNAVALNNLAWSLSSVPGEPWFDPKKGLALARKAVAIEPMNGVS